MSKAHRGTGLRKTANHGRGTCPICKTTGIKVVYEYDLEGKKVMICKFCKAHLKNKARLEKPAAAPADAAPAAEEAAAEAPAEAQA
ncbi:MAG: hypothetical protein IJL24_08840 [Treponema sp.]|jgi:hypothetical protein|nr:hypothetical protein [Treponema sp.]